MTTIACVLRSGGDFTPEWVYALKRGLNRWVKAEYRFVCLTDVQGLPPVWSVPLRYPWPGWWAKMRLLDPDLFKPAERIFYVDLDTLPVGPPDELLGYDGPLGMMTGFYRDIPQSGVMAWTPGPVTEALWERWIRDPDVGMRSARGDGEWIGAQLGEMGVKPDRMMDLYPGQIVSLKLHAKAGPPPGARLVLGHGQPRLSDPAAGWAHDEWRRWARSEAA